MTNGLPEQPSLREHVERYLAAVADKLSAYSIQARLSWDDGTLLATDSHSGRAGTDISMDSDTWIQAAWAPAPGSDPATAGTILTVLNAISPGMTFTAAMPAAR